jgi:hypothetical protein
MRAGRELDALVAEKVMGWKWIGPDEFNDNRHLTLGGQKVQARIPDYSTDIAAAWDVVEKMRPTFNLVLECVSLEYNCHVARPGHLDEKVNVRADTAPLAICLAALKACGVEVAG